MKAFLLFLTACGAASDAYPAAYAIELDACTTPAQSSTEAESRACRERVQCKYRPAKCGKGELP